MSTVQKSPSVNYVIWHYVPLVLTQKGPGDVSEARIQVTMFISQNRQFLYAWSVRKTTCKVSNT